MEENKPRLVYFLPLLMVLVIAAVDYCIYRTNGVSGINDWISIYTIEGLFLDAVGAIIVLAGDLSLLRRHFIPTGRINSITDGRSRLFDDEVLSAHNKGFDEIWPIIKDRAQIDETDANTVMRLEVATSSRRRNIGAGISRRVYPCIEKQDWSREEYLENLADGVEPKEHPPERYDRLESAGSPALVDGWLDQEIRRVEQNAKQIPLRIGVLFFLTGFSVQGISQIISLV